MPSPRDLFRALSKALGPSDASVDQSTAGAAIVRDGQVVARVLWRYWGPDSGRVLAEAADEYAALAAKDAGPDGPSDPYPRRTYDALEREIGGSDGRRERHVTEPEQDMAEPEPGTCVFSFGALDIGSKRP